VRRFKDIIHHDPYFVTPETTVKELTRELVERQVAGCPVLDGQGKVVGVVSFTDIAVKQLFPRPGEVLPDREEQLVKDIMTSPALTIGHDSNVAHAVELFDKHRVQRLTVTDGERLVGIITPWDLMTVLQERIPAGTPGARSSPPPPRRSISLGA
jgi:CBS domain-containing protein